MISEKIPHFIKSIWVTSSKFIKLKGNWKVIIDKESWHWQNSTKSTIMKLVQWSIDQIFRVAN
jgi:hypothetical protein